MIDEARGPIDYDERGTGPTLVLVPGSCSTGAAWRPITAAWNNQFRCVTTSLLGYGGTAERRTPLDASLSINAEAVESVLRKASGKVHLIGHSAGAVIALSVALRKQVPLASLVTIEPPVPMLLKASGEDQHYDVFRNMTDAYISDFESGNAEAIASMIDFYGGAGTFAAWPAKVRQYAVETTPTNILDWAGNYGFALSELSLAAISIPTLVMVGGASHVAMKRASGLIAKSVNGGKLVTIEGASHFLIATHAIEVARHVAEHVHRAEVM
jgi:pimeloyl-ACP methyl ester carboxylesterase